MSMSIGKRFISSPNRMAPSVFSLATVNPVSGALWSPGLGGPVLSDPFTVGTGTHPYDVSLQCITCLVPAVNDVAGTYDTGGTEVGTFNLSSIVTQNLTVTTYQFIFRANFLSYAPANILQRIGAAAGNNIQNATDDDLFYVENVTAGTLRLHMVNGGSATNSPAVAVAAGMHTHEIRFDTSANVWWFIDGVLVYSDVTGTSFVPWNVSIAPFYYVKHVAGAASGTYDLNIAFIGQGCLFG